ncbi:hypothetical protein AVEN_117022-1, partial [Araneus ventricosus]
MPRCVGMELHANPLPLGLAGLSTGLEQLLLSVIPAYIAAEVKRSIMLKMADACQSANSHSKQRFHELYVQRHNNV